MFNLKFPGPGFASVWSQSHQLTAHCQVILASPFLTQKKYCTAFGIFLGLFYNIVMSLQQLNDGDT